MSFALTNTNGISTVTWANPVVRPIDPDRRLVAEDALTGLLTRSAFHAALQNRIETGWDGEFSLLVLNLDRFKPVNEVLGHSSGDEVLKAVSERLRSVVQHSDLIGRLSGDEFAIIHWEGSQPSGSQTLADRIIDCLSRPFVINHQTLYIGVSIGCALAPYDGGSADDLLRNADLALCRARTDGRGVLRYFEPAMEAQVRARRELESDLRRAIEEGEFQMYYQPIMDVNRNEIVTFEALIRWFHPERGMIPPDSFIPLAEQTGLIVPLGEWVLRTACREATRWDDHTRVAVNLSTVQLLDNRLVEIVVDALHETGLSPERLELEITETALLTENDLTIGMLHQFREIGIQISLDDFGSGYSSINYLRRFPFDKIKIDRSFVSGADHDEESMALVRMIASLGATLGVKTTAEGVETAGELESIRDAGCTEIQGYWLSRPIPANEIPTLMKNLSRTQLQAIVPRKI